MCMYVYICVYLIVYMCFMCAFLCIFVCSVEKVKLNVITTIVFFLAFYRF